MPMDSLVFSAQGGDLKIYHDYNKFVIVHLEPGMILAGQWYQRVYCPCPSTGKRNTFILYSDNKIVNSGE